MGAESVCFAGTNGHSHVPPAHREPIEIDHDGARKIASQFLQERHALRNFSSYLKSGFADALGALLELGYVPPDECHPSHLISSYPWGPRPRRRGPRYPAPRGAVL